MLLLAVDVAHQLLQLAPTNGKIAITSLPEERAILLSLGLNPGRRGLLDFLQEFCLTKRARQPRCDMDVICGAPNAVGWAITIPAQGGQVGVQARSDGRVKPGAAVFGAEDDVENDLAKGLRHRIRLFELSRPNQFETL